MTYASGKHARAMCFRCGTEVRYTDLQEEWDGKWTCPDCFDPKHPQIDPIRHIDDPTALEHPYPDNDDDGEVSVQLETLFPGNNFGSKG